MKKLTKEAIAKQKEQYEKVSTLLDKIKTEFSDFQENSRCLNNKSAARRARKSSLVIQGLLKKYRSISIK